MKDSNAIVPLAGSCAGEGVPSIPLFFGNPCYDLTLSSFGGSSSTALHRLSVAVGVLQSFLDVAGQSPLFELVEDLTYYEGIMASPLQMVQSSGESLSSIGSKVVRILVLCAQLTCLSKGHALDVVKPLLTKKGAIESEYSTVCDRKRSDLAKVGKSERDVVAQLECLRSCHTTLERETVDLDVSIKDRWCYLEVDSFKMKGLEQSLRLVNADLRKLSFDPAFLDEVGASYTSSVESKARNCIEDVIRGDGAFEGDNSTYPTGAACLRSSRILYIKEGHLLPLPFLNGRYCKQHIFRNWVEFSFEDGGMPGCPNHCPHGYTHQDFLLDHSRSLFRNMSDWSTDELRWAPEYLTPYLDSLRRTGYGTLQVENLLRVISYWVSVVGVMEGLTD
ncbi:hypothetical protein MRB53_023885 [Persea americana]|uniref:Uncharacterized protein n=1 Tax=Persea americana TaxID=3435 RepID=A0ACC2LB09_PERAE|nr:hypothetical protein MRB53_023885 [Persea americana]